MVQEDKFAPTNSYQDDINDDPEATDPLQEELSENPADELGVPQDAYTNGLNNDPEMSHEPDDARENTEDLDEDSGDQTKAA